MSVAEVCDQEARNMATNAVHKINTHEEVCAVRWRTTMETMGEIKRIMGWATAAAIGTLLSMVAFLLVHH